MEMHFSSTAKELLEFKGEYINRCHYAPPTAKVLKPLVMEIAEVIFPGYLNTTAVHAEPSVHDIAMSLEKINIALVDQVERALRFCRDNNTIADTDSSRESLELKARQIACDFIDSIPEIRRRLLTDVEAVLMADPAVTGIGEVVFCYPTIVALTHHRIAHMLHKLGVPLAPRMITEIAHSKTGIDIHPAAVIGDYFAIDHGTGVVIGETAIIGKHVVIYQGVTLGAKSFKQGEDGRLVNEPRHPIIEDNVKIYSNASILGRITIGHDSIIGGNTWIDQDVAPHSKITQLKRS